MRVFKLVKQTGITSNNKPDKLEINSLWVARPHLKELLTLLSPFFPMTINFLHAKFILSSESYFIRYQILIHVRTAMSANPVPLNLTAHAFPCTLL